MRSLDVSGTAVGVMRCVCVGVGGGEGGGGRGVGGRVCVCVGICMYPETLVNLTVFIWVTRRGEHHC